MHCKPCRCRLLHDGQWGGCGRAAATLAASCATCLRVASESALHCPALPSCTAAGLNLSSIGRARRAPGSLTRIVGTAKALELTLTQRIHRRGDRAFAAGEAWCPRWWRHAEGVGRDKRRLGPAHAHCVSAIPNLAHGQAPGIGCRRVDLADGAGSVPSATEGGYGDFALPHARRSTSTRLDRAIPLLAQPPPAAPRFLTARFQRRVVDPARSKAGI